MLARMSDRTDLPRRLRKSTRPVSANDANAMLLTCPSASVSEKRIWRAVRCIGRSAGECGVRSAECGVRTAMSFQGTAERRIEGEISWDELARAAPLQHAL